jgi:hypothetical protein
LQQRITATRGARGAFTDAAALNRREIDLHGHALDYLHINA